MTVLGRAGRAHRRRGAGGRARRPRSCGARVAAAPRAAGVPALTRSVRRVGDAIRTDVRPRFSVVHRWRSRHRLVHRSRDRPGRCRRLDLGFEPLRFPGASTPGSRSTTIPTKQGWIRMAADDREKALDAALAQIERQFGKGSVMRLGDETPRADRGDPHRLDRARRRARHRRAAARPGRRDLRPGVLRQDHRRAARGRQRPGAPAASPPSSTPSTRSTRTTPRRSASTPTRCWSPSPTPASRRWRSPTC